MLPHPFFYTMVCNLGCSFNNKLPAGKGYVANVRLFARMGYMKIRKIDPACNLDTVRDGRGGIFTFLPDKPIVGIQFPVRKQGQDTRQSLPPRVRRILFVHRRQCGRRDEG